MRRAVTCNHAQPKRNIKFSSYDQRRRWLWGGGHAPNIWAGGSLSRVPLPHYSRSQLKSSCLYLLISWHFISPKRMFYFLLCQNDLNNLLEC